MIPRAYQPTPRQREHRTLVRHRQFLQSRITSVRSKVHHILSNSNADRKDLFSAQCGPAHFKEVPLSDADRFVIKQLWAEWREHIAQRDALTKKIKAFVAKATQREKEDRALLMTAPGVGFVTTEVVLSELAGSERFRNAQTVCAYAGVVPAVRQSGDKRSKDVRITKEGSGLLRWALAESAWRLVRTSPKWAARYARLKERKGKKRAIVAVARKLLCVLYAMLGTRTPYKIVTTETKAPRTSRKRLVLVRTPTAEQTPATETATATATPTTTHQNQATATTTEQATTTKTTKPRTTRENPQTATTETAKPRAARQRSVKTPDTAPEQTTTRETTKPRTTRENLVKTPIVEQPPITEMTAPKTTRGRSAKPPAAEQLTTV